MTHQGYRPSYQWFPGDFRRDVALQACSFEARALWREMLDLMHDGTPYGHLTAGGVPIDVAQLARMVGVAPTKVARWLDELEARRVFSRTAEGVIYSRRMLRDEHIRTVRAASGKRGGNPVLLKQTDNQPDNHRDKRGDNHRPNLAANQSGKQTPTPASASAVEASSYQDGEYISPPKAPPAPTPPAPTAAPDGAGRNGGAARPGWVTTLGEDWIRARGGTAAFGKIGAALKALVQREGLERVRPAWLAFVASDRARFGPSHFAEHFGDFLPKTAEPPRAANGTPYQTPAEIRAANEAELEAQNRRRAVRGERPLSYDEAYG